MTTDGTAGTDPVRIAFVCVQNAGRSQMASAFARRELGDRGLEDEVELLTGGTRPAERVHPEVVDAMEAVGIDVSDRSPRNVTFEALQSSDYVITMGCKEACPAGRTGENRDWDLGDPDGRPSEQVAGIRDEIEERVNALFDELEVSDRPKTGPPARWITVDVRAPPAVDDGLSGFVSRVESERRSTDRPLLRVRI